MHYSQITPPTQIAPSYPMGVTSEMTLGAHADLGFDWREGKGKEMASPKCLLCMSK